MTTCLGKSSLFLNVFRGRLLICMCSSFPFGFDRGMWVVIVLIQDHYHSIYFLPFSCLCFLLLFILVSWVDFAL